MPLKVSLPSDKDAQAERVCPGEKYAISRAICRTRQRNQYPKCLLCPHRSAEAAGTMVTDPKVSSSVFRSSAVIGRVPEEMNEYVVRKVGLAAAQFLRAESAVGSRLVVGCDLRDNSRGFTRIFCEGANRGGMDCVNVGTMPPEMLAFVLGTDGCTGAAFIGGGSYPADVNAIRIWRRDATPVGFGGGLEKIGLIARRLRTGCSRQPGEMAAGHPLAEYVAYMRKFAPNLEPLKLVVDAGAGAGGRVLQALLAGLPVEPTFTGLDDARQGALLGRRFPASTVVESVGSAVRQAGADLGAAIDFGGERIAFFDETGELLRHDVAAGLIASELLARTPGACIVHDLRASAALRTCITRAEGTPVAAPTGPLAFGQHFRRNDAVYGADMSGLHYFKDFYRFPSPFLALLMTCAYVSRRKQPVTVLAADLTRFSRSGEIVIPIPTPEAAEELLARVREEFPEAEREMIDGLTVRTQDWWLNLRRPGKAAELRLNVEGRSDRDLRRGRQTIERLISRLMPRSA